MDNFRRPKRPAKGVSIDGVMSGRKRSSTITPHANRVDFRRRENFSREANQTIGDFSKQDGFHPASKTVLSASSAGEGSVAIPAQNPPFGRRGSVVDTPKPKKRRLFGRKKDKKDKKPRSLRYKITKRILIALLILSLLIGGFLGWKFVRNTGKVFQGNVFGLFNSTKLKGEDRGRVNILLVGTSEDDPGHSGASLTDSIMIISIDTVNHNAFMMSVPRDLWVNYETTDCSLGYQGKINAVYECGEEIKFRENGYPDGGIGLLQKVIHENLGIDFNYYSKINYTAFRDAVNAVGGIDVTIKTDDQRGLYDGNIGKEDGGPLKLSNGVHHLDGQTALNLARARCDTVCYGITKGDFDRTEHQREMLLALKDKALSLGVLSNPAKIASLMDAVGNNVKTDFQTNEIRRLYEIGKEIPNQNIKSIGLADENVHMVTTGMIGNQSVVIPSAGKTDFSDIQLYIKRLISNDPVVREGASVVVLNGSGVDGLATKTGKQLTSAGIDVKTVSNTSSRAQTTVIALSSQKTATNNYLNKTFNVTSTTDTSTFAQAKNYNVDFVIILGQNEANN